MMESVANDRPVVWQNSRAVWALLAVLAALFAAVAYDGLREMVRIWSTTEAYSHGFLIPVLSLFLVWQRRDRLRALPFSGSWLGVAILAVGIFVLFLGELSTLYILVQYGALIMLVGAVLAFAGARATRVIWAPLLLLTFMIPLPRFLSANLSAQLQLLSSKLGVTFIRWCDISVFLEGNVIDLGAYKLQVAEACSGLNYLFPLMSLAFLCAYLFRAPVWQRLAIFLSSIPITIVMNSFRIGVIGVLVEYWGIEMAEGFLHFFEGWAVFMLCTAILIGEMWVFARFSSERRGLRDLLALEMPARAPQDASARLRPVPRPLVAAIPLLLAAAVASAALGERQELIPERVEFSRFPMEVGAWRGHVEQMELHFIQALKFDDYLLADYRNDGYEPVNFYVAYYGSQRKGESAHSPRSCIPGGGWQIAGLDRRVIDGVRIGAAPLTVNRVDIRKGEYKQLVYYWFQQRGRVITNEYLVKWYLFWDALTRNRTDGALVRLTTLVPPEEDIAHADERLADFARQVTGLLGEYVPG